MKILITGSNGFIGKNLSMHLNEYKEHTIFYFKRGDSIDRLNSYINDIDFIFHLAGENKPLNNNSFQSGNVDLTKSLCDFIVHAGKSIPIVFSSTRHANFEEKDPSDLITSYAKSKLSAEDILQSYSKKTRASIYIYRLPGVFGKWSKPNYNSVVATFCYNIANELPLQINDNNKTVSLVYIDDLIKSFISLLSNKSDSFQFETVTPEYSISLSKLANTISDFALMRNNNLISNVGVGLIRALYSTYISYLPKNSFSYKIPFVEDTRGIFSEFLKTNNAGQISFFTAHPGVTRGEHYHHSKVEKFLVINGNALFNFRNILTDETYEILTEAKTPQVVETIPGWAHNIKNIGTEDLIVILWANELFNKDVPDTFHSMVKKIES